MPFVYGNDVMSHAAVKSQLWVVKSARYELGLAKKAIF
jgi:hypothetical protein